MSEATLSRPTRSAWIGEIRSTLALSWPLILTNVAQTGMTATDVLMLGRLGPEAVAASALGANLYFFFLMFGIGVMSATSSLVAAQRGRMAHSVREVRRILRQGIWAAVCISVPCWAALWNGETVLRWLGQDPKLAAEAGAYLHTLQWSILPFLLYLALRSFMAAMERPAWAMAAVFIGLGANALANWLLIFGHWGFPRLGVPGSGLATLCATTLMALVLVGVLMSDRRFRRYRVFGRLWRPDWSRFRAFWRLGLPIGVTVLFEASIFQAAVVLMGLIGETALAAHAVAIQIASLTFMVPLGMGQAATVRVGRAFGARDPHGATLAGWTAFALGVGFMACTAVLMVSAPNLLIGAFLDVSAPTNAHVVETATLFLAFAALFQVADGAQVVGAGMLRGLHDTRVPMWFAALGYWGLGFPLGATLAFPLHWGGAGVWAGLAAGLAVVAVLMLWRWARRDALGLVPRMR
ncbi:MATE family efflux transporter [Alsobacter soli]|uniref:Multidrug-efflux transporter n=1 Tax=Alsobacter soli TaxID=2109933 RepID=A0A2T1HP06_9HYPH|nr:MATE family efflux transporter [Alsobacter soli]PSC03380.1 MATE family efflux transporter [Alsobacter soli]